MTPEKMTEEELIALLQYEEADADSYHQSELATAQKEAMDRYFRRPYGNELADRSKVVTGDLEETIAWIMPDLMRCFMSTDELVTLKAGSKEDDTPYKPQQQPDMEAEGQLPQQVAGKSPVELQASYLSHIFFEDNDGETNIHDFVFDGLLQRIGVLQATWEDPEPGVPYIIEDLTPAQLGKYLDDPEYKVHGWAEESTEDGPVYMLEVAKNPAVGKVRVEAVPPEEFRVHKRAKSLKHGQCKYHGRKRLAYVAELARQHPDKADELFERRGTAIESIESDPRAQARHPGDAATSVDGTNDKGRRQCMVCEEFVLCDFDGDGIVELRFVKRVDKILLQNEAVERSDFYTWTPSRVSHKVVGRSLHDILDDLQRIKTQITRSYLDSLGGSLNPRTYYDSTSITEDGLDQLLANEEGACIGMKGNPHEKVLEVVAPDIGGSAITALEYFEQRSEIATGVTRQSAGMDPQALNKTATGIDLLQAAAKSRIELIARWVGKALEDVFEHINFLTVSHQNKTRQVKLFGEWVEVDPRRWRDEAAVSIHVGSAGVSKQQRLMNLGLVSQKQEQIISLLGPSNPLAGLSQYKNTLKHMVQLMGFKDETEFFGNVTPEFDQQMQQKPDPKMQEAMAKQQLAQAEAQHKAQMAEAEFGHRQQIETLKIQGEQRIAEVKASMEFRIAQMKLEAETEIARERMDRETELAKWRAGHEIDIKRQMSNGSGVRMGGAIG